MAVDLFGLKEALAINPWHQAGTVARAAGQKTLPSGGRWEDILANVLFQGATGAATGYGQYQAQQQVDDANARMLDYYRTGDIPDASDNSLLGSRLKRFEAEKAMQDLEFANDLELAERKIDYANTGREELEGTKQANRVIIQDMKNTGRGLPTPASIAAEKKRALDFFQSDGYMLDSDKELFPGETFIDQRGEDTLPITNGLTTDEAPTLGTKVAELGDDVTQIDMTIPEDIVAPADESPPAKMKAIDGHLRVLHPENGWTYVERDKAGPLLDQLGIATEETSAIGGGGAGLGEDARLDSVIPGGTDLTEDEKRLLAGGMEGGSGEFISAYKLKQIAAQKKMLDLEEARARRKERLAGLDALKSLGGGAYGWNPKDGAPPTKNTHDRAEAILESTSQAESGMRQLLKFYVDASAKGKDPALGIMGQDPEQLDSLNKFITGSLRDAMKLGVRLDTGERPILQSAQIKTLLSSPIGVLGREARGVDQADILRKNIEALRTTRADVLRELGYTRKVYQLRRR